MNIDFKETYSATSPAIADFLIKFSLFVEGRNDNGAEYSAFIHMTPTDYQKYFCKGRENENPAACALEDWKDVKCTVLDLSGYCSQDEGNVEVSILSREEICNIPIEPYEDDDEYLWNKLIDKAGIPWQEEEHFRKELATNVTNFVANLAADSSANNVPFPAQPADVPILIELYASVDRNPFTYDNDSAVMLLEDFRKYFCPAGVDPTAYAEELWNNKEDWYYFAGYELPATIYVYTYTAEDIRDGKYTETKSGDFENTLWGDLENFTNDDAPKDWDALRETLQQNVKSLLHSLTTTAHITCEIPMEKLDAFKAYVESLGGSWQE